MARSQYLIPIIEQPRVRRASDVSRVVIGVLVFAWAWRVYEKTPDVEQSLNDLIGWIPGWLDGTLSVVYATAMLYVWGVIIAIGLQWRGRLDAARDMVLAGVAVVALTTLSVRINTDSWPRVLVELGLAEPISQYPIFRVAFVSAALLVVEPHLTRPMRRVGRAMILLAGLAGVGLGLGLLSSAVGAVALGVASSGLVLLIFGSPKGYPDTTSISEALDILGIGVSDLELDDDQSWGVRRLIGHSREHGLVEVKAYG